MAARRRGRNKSGDKRRGNVSEAYIAQSDLIVQCARKCVETKGVRKTTLTDIAREAGLTRELLYYYFANKQEIIDCLIDSYVQDGVDTARLWCDSWCANVKDGDAVLSREAVADIVASLRRFVFTADGSRRSMFAVLNEIDQRKRVFSRICNEILREVQDSVVEVMWTNTFPHFAVCDSEIMLKFMMLGLIGLLEDTDVRDDFKIVDALLVGARTLS